MNRKLIINILLVVFVFGLAGLSLHIGFPNLFSSKDEIITKESSQITVAKYPVYRGIIIHTYETDGKVVSGRPEVYIEQYIIENVIENGFELLKHNGENFTKGEYIFRVKGEQKAAEFNGKIVAIDYFNGKRDIQIGMLNYDALYVETWIEQETYEKINNSTIVKLIIGEKEYDAKIIKMGYELIDEMIYVQISVPTSMLPGTKVEVSYVMDEGIEGLYVPVDAVYHSGDGYYAFVQEDQTKKQVEIEVGQEFVVEEEGNVFKYIEILSGVKEGDVLLVEQVQDYSAKIKKEFSDE